MLRFKQLVIISILVTFFMGLYIVFTWQSHPENNEPFVVEQEIVMPVNIDSESDKQNTEETVKTDSDSKNSNNPIVNAAKEISKNSNTILVTMVNDAYLPFTYSWLCNTKLMDVHKTVLIITTDKSSRDKLTKDWPEIHVVAMDMENAGGDQVYSHVGYVQIMIRRTEMLLDIVNADVEIFLFEVDCLWLTNPVPDLQKMNEFDVLVNPVAERPGVYAGGFLYLFTTEKAKSLWKELTNQMHALGERIKTLPKDKYISEADNDQIYFSGLITKK